MVLPTIMVASYKYIVPWNKFQYIIAKYFIFLHGFDHEMRNPSIIFAAFQHSRRKPPRSLSAVKNKIHSSGI